MFTPKEIEPQADRSEFCQPDTLTLIDRAVSAAKVASRACTTETARHHYQFALALLNESWIAESGQNANSAETVIENVNNGLRFLARLSQAAVSE